ncbi:MAG: sodium:proton antiporter, partial [Planctomycetota bacterium]
MTSPAVLNAGILALGIAAQWIAWRLRLPAIVLLLVFGAILGWLAPVDASDVNQEFFYAVVSLAVGIILFEGGLSLDFREIRGAGGVVARLVTVGLAMTWLLTATLAHWIAGFSWPMSLLLGAVLTVSGPTVVLPLLRHVQPVRRIGSLAKWEGIVNDPIGAVLAALVFEVVSQSGGEGMASNLPLRDFWITILLGTLLGVSGAWFLLHMLRRHLTPDYLQNPVILAFVMLVFAVSNALQHESGLVTVTVMGIVLANQRGVAIRHVVEFKENLSVLLISTLFIVLSRRLQLDATTLASLGWSSLLLAALVITLVRPTAVFVSTVGSGLDWREKAFLGWIHPRGIVAAAVSSVFALRLTQTLGPESPFAGETQRFELTVFLVIAATVVVYGLTLGPLARRLGLSGANPQGILFAGASRPVREIAMAVKNEGFAVLLVDTNPRNNAAARMAGLTATYASIGSEYV